ncbi:putative transmembrane protein [Senna tora]|uniref:Putative transmembrane protein n=1 Tax=Senna tora TaxID=362788 RepID=A0A834W108_9FABA|nr:putative transmembrane protein [Senna tora]
MACPPNSIPFNGSLCACPPGYLLVLDRPSNSCTLFTPNSSITTVSGVDYYALTFPETLFAFDSIKKFTQSQAVFLEATFLMLLSWLLLCFFLRFMNLGDAHGSTTTLWFHIRWWISRFDICFATRHWLDDQMLVKKRKTELGGTFSIASWILFIGLFAALLYQIITKRTIEVHNVRATNRPELNSFLNAMEFNITTISSMSCSNLRDLGSLVTGNPGFIDQRVVSLSTLVNYSCHNSSKGPTITLKCKNCKLLSDNMYISWQFADLPNNPATAVGFEFNLSAKDNANKHVSFVSGTLKNGSALDDRPVTFRGRESNILKFNLFPQIYHNLHDLKLIQPLFHEFLPGSVCRDTNQLQSSLENSLDGLVNTTLFINFLSAYVVEIDKKSIMGPVSFLADLGGLYCISIGIFFYLLIQCEYRIKKLRNEDSILRRIRNRRKAQEHWDKLRKYVMYTYGCSALDDNHKNSKMESSCSGFILQSIHGSGSSRKRRQQSRTDSISLYKKDSLPANKVALGRWVISFPARWCTSNLPSLGSWHLRTLSCKPLESTNDQKQQSKSLAKQQSVGSSKEVAQSQPQESSFIDSFIPPPPSLEFKGDSEMDMSDIKKNLKSLHDYNVMLREKLVAAQSLFHSSTSRRCSQPDVTLTGIITEARDSSEHDMVARILHLLHRIPLVQLCCSCSHSATPTAKSHTRIRLEVGAIEDTSTSISIALNNTNCSDIL